MGNVSVFITEDSVPVKYTGIGTYAYSACEKLTTVSLPDKPIDIDETAFYNSNRVQFHKRSI